MDVKLGLGLATGMFYHAPAGTALPTSPSASIAAAWEKVGDVTDAGITLSLSKSVTNLKNWANVINSKGELPPEEAFLWVMKDGNDMMMVGCSYGQVSAVDDISFAPGAAINWTPTITAMGDDGFKLIFDETTA